MGGSRGLWSDTAVSLLAVLRYLPPEEAPRAPLLEAVLAAVLLLLAAAVLVRAAPALAPSLVPASLLALTVAGIEVSGRLLGARFPVERAALPVQFLFLAAATGVAGDWIAGRRSGWKPASAAVFLSAGLAVAAFAAAAGRRERSSGAMTPTTPGCWTTSTGRAASAASPGPCASGSPG